MWTDSAGMQAMPVPKAIDADDITRVKSDFVRAAELAIAAAALLAARGTQPWPVCGR